MIIEHQTVQAVHFIERLPNVMQSSNILHYTSIAEGGDCHKLIPMKSLSDCIIDLNVFDRGCRRMQTCEQIRFLKRMGFVPTWITCLSRVDAPLLMTKCT